MAEAWGRKYSTGKSCINQNIYNFSATDFILCHNFLSVLFIEITKWIMPERERERERESVWERESEREGERDWSREVLDSEKSEYLDPDDVRWMSQWNRPGLEKVIGLDWWSKSWCNKVYSDLLNNCLIINLFHVYSNYKKSRRRKKKTKIKLDISFIVLQNGNTEVQTYFLLWDIP